MLQLTWTDMGLEDLAWWVEHNPNVLKRKVVPENSQRAHSLSLRGLASELRMERFSLNLGEYRQLAAGFFNTCQNPKTGIGKPEPLGFDLQCYWSRRITQEHRRLWF